MFKKFGELTLEELNQTAAGFKDEGDIKSLNLKIKATSSCRIQS